MSLLARRIDAIQAGLSWEIGPGPLGGRLLVVSAGGNPDHRALARRWLLSAPEPDGISPWEFSDQRPPVDDPVGAELSPPGRATIRLADVLVGARQRGARLDVTVFHPELCGLDEDTRLRIAFHALDTTLGESDTELWIGEVEATTTPPRDGFGLGDLAIAVTNLRKEYVDDDGNPAWVLLHADSPQGPVVASAIVPLHPVIAPNLTHHVGMLVPYVGFAERGLPSSDALCELRRLEDRLTSTLGADGRVVAHETTNGVRLLHAYIDPTTSAPQRVEEALCGWAHGDVITRVDTDPAWEAVRPLRA
ncbi:hypothetical protein J2S40_000974 [Nocardioides luteus]|uniref:DUF695 domain-containing protein n=1 Tax=Nocardioides luteus TaxID=1844 RepID=UPI0016643763|nr:DUF695 domain-containing protein [Nocardioides luteus]MDR7309916.1 hypothetical protein [Nocardioides luteus]